MIEVVVLAEAERDRLEIWRRCDEMLAGLGDRFDAAFDKASEHIAQFPEAAALWRKLGFRRKIVVGFPIGIFYKIHGNRALIRAVLDLRQSDEAIIRRLTD
jgi:hypothetical protein